MRIGIHHRNFDYKSKQHITQLRQYVTFYVALFTDNINPTFKALIELHS
jgi:hypothetical protein